jgi:hypothetical protein
MVLYALTGSVLFSAIPPIFLFLFYLPLKSIFDEADLRRPGCPAESDAHHGEGHRTVFHLFFFEVPLRNADDFPLFAHMDRFFGRSKPCSGPGFDFEKSYPSVLLADGVDFPQNNPVIFLEKLIPGSAQKIERHHLAPIP